MILLDFIQNREIFIQKSNEFINYNTNTEISLTIEIRLLSNKTAHI